MELEVRKPTYEELLAENAQLKKRIAEQEQRIAEQDREIAALKAKHAEEVALLKAQIEKLTRMLFGHWQKKLALLWQSRGGKKIGGDYVDTFECSAAWTE